VYRREDSQLLDDCRKRINDKDIDSAFSFVVYLAFECFLSLLSYSKTPELSTYLPLCPQLNRLVNSLHSPLSSPPQPAVPQPPHVFAVGHAVQTHGATGHAVPVYPALPSSL
jgi:hypothetical protein